MASLLEQLLAPIQEGAFCGDDGSYDSDFETCKAEAEKITENNWEAMSEAGERFLTKTSKDLRAFGFLVLAKGMTKGATALAEVAQAYATVSMEHWEDIFPKRPNGRVQALKWLVSDGVKSRIAGIAPSGNYETLLAATEAMKKFQQFVFNKFPEQPSFEGFTAILHEWTEKNKPKAEPPPPDPNATPAQGGETSSAGGGDISLGSPDDAYLALQKVAGFFFEQGKLNPIAYRLMRLSRWSMLSELPPNQGGRTLIPAPYPDTLTAFRNLFAAADWPTLAENGEGAFTQDGMLFWFDLQRYLCAALEGLGGEGVACSEALKQELALLLKRLPGLEALSFDDGTPFADAATQDWLATDVAGALGGGGGAPRKGKAKSDIAAEAEEAEKLFAQEKLQEALAVYKAGLAADSSAKSNFDRKLRMADLCLRGGKPLVAMALGEELKRLLDGISVEAWDPEACVALFRTLRKAYHMIAETGADPTGNLPARSLEALSRLSRLDPLAAVQSE